tara:strand:- start:268 stop:429 length:162 start_codon:yes stop_codon:yes gene_type:complete
MIWFNFAEGSKNRIAKELVARMKIGSLHQNEARLVISTKIGEHPELIGGYRLP